jgi:hypothetical protein
VAQTTNHFESDVSLPQLGRGASDPFSTVAGRLRVNEVHRYARIDLFRAQDLKIIDLSDANTYVHDIHTYLPLAGVFRAYSDYLSIRSLDLLLDLLSGRLERSRELDFRLDCPDETWQGRGVPR